MQIIILQLQEASRKLELLAASYRVLTEENAGLRAEAEEEHQRR